MKLFITLADSLFPLFIFFIVIFCIFSKNDLVKSFKKGAIEGMKTSFEIIPNILLIMVSSALIRQTGALGYFVNIISPFLSKLSIPDALCELVLMRPVSGGGSVVLLTDIYKNLGADSYEGLIASVIAASTETTLYTVSIYYGATKVKKTFIPLTAGLLADVFTVFFAIFIVNLFFC